METSSFISDNRRKAEIVAVLVTATGKFVFMDCLEWKLPFILVAILGWSTYVLKRQRQVPDIIKYWGFRFDNFRQVLRIVLPFGITSVIMFVVIGFYLDTVNITWHIIQFYYYILFGVLFNNFLSLA